MPRINVVVCEQTKVTDVESAASTRVSCPSMDGNHDDSEASDIDDEKEVCIEDICSDAIDDLVFYFDPQNSKMRSDATHMKQLMFYQLVQGGNVPGVKIILEFLQSTNKPLLESVLTGNESTDRVSLENPSKLTTFVNCCVYILMAILFTVLTPVFYGVHWITCTSNNGRGIMETNHLPLMFAVMSSNVKMVKLFAERKRNILACVDNSGFSIFHYLADLSTTDCTRSNRYFEILLEVFGIEEVRDVLMNVKARSNGLTGLEFAVSIGSPVYFTKLLETEGIFKRTKLTITKDKIFKSQSKQKSTEDVDEFKLCEYDVTRYESGDVSINHGFLLILLANRDLLEMSDDEVDSLNNCLFLNSWMRAKHQHNSVLVRTVNCLGVLFTMFLVIYILSLSDGDAPNTLENMFWSIYSSDDIPLGSSTSSLNMSVIATNCSIDNFKQKNVLDKMQTVCTGLNVSNYISFDSDTCQMQTGGGNSLMENYSTYLSLVCMFSATAITICDVIGRLTYLTLHYFNSDSISLSTSDRIRHTFSRPMQISYVSRQLTIVACCFLADLVFFGDIRSKMHATSAEAANANAYIQSAVVIHIVGAGSCRLFNALYSLRVGKFGIFVITICKMMKIVLQFSGVYLLMLIAFADLFFFTVKNPDCPAALISPFNSYSSVLVSLFSLTLGDNKLPPLTTFELDILYVIYMVLTSIVMLSLLTGISGSVADRVMSRRLKFILPATEELEDALEAETMLLMFAYPFRKLVHRWRMENAKEPYRVRRKEEHLNITVEIATLP